MTKILNFNDSTVKLLRKEVEEAIKTVAAKYGLKASGIGNIGYTSTAMHTGKLSFAVEASQPDTNLLPLESFVGKSFKMGSRVFNIRGVEGEKLLGVTNRGARYLISRENLATMIQL